MFFTIMKNIFLIKVAKSHYCKAVFLATLIGSYFLIPSKVFVGVYTWIAILFMLLFSMVFTCFVREIKEEIKNKRRYGVSFLGIVAGVAGFSAIQFCGVGAPVCGATLGVLFLSSVLPSFFVGILSGYSNLILIGAIGVQILTLIYLGCFKRVNIVD